MNHPPRNHPDKPERSDRDMSSETLITRLVDGEATDDDRVHFEHLAGSEPTLWRQLAMRQQDYMLLTAEVHRVTAAAAGRALRFSWLAPRRLTWPLVLSGWAAVLIVSLSWALMTLVTTPRPGASASPASLSPEEHYTRYRSAPYVLGEMHPEVLQVDELTDGRVAVHFLRRIEEIAFLDPSLPLPIDENGELTRDPIRLRATEPKLHLPN
jgi:hypothetical protein